MTFDMQDWLDHASVAAGLTPRETRVLLRMSRYAGYKNGDRVRPSTETLAESLGIHPSHLRGKNGAIGSLCAKGWLVLVSPSRQRQPATYRLAYGAVLSDPSTGGGEPEVAVLATPGGVSESATSGASGVAAAATPADREPDARGIQNGSLEVSVSYARGIQNGSLEVSETATRTTYEQRKEQRSEQRRSRADAHEPASPHDARADGPATVQGVVIDTPQTGTDLATQATRTVQDAKQLSEELAKRLRSRGMANVAADRKSAAAMTALLNNGATPEQISHVIRWVTTEDTSFWAKQVVNAATFCKHYDQIVAEARHAISRRNAEQDGRTARQRASDEQSARWRAMPEPEPKAIERPKTGEEQLAALLAAKQTA